MKKIKDLFRQMGLVEITSFPEPYKYNIKDYNLSSEDDSEKIEAHKDFLKTVIDEENGRLESIDSKTSQLISQASIVFSLVGLVIPIVIDKSGETKLFFKIVIIGLLLAAFFFYILSISNALKNFHIVKFKYYVPSPANVLNFKNKTLTEFHAELVRDYLLCINKNIVLNNIKATNLLHSQFTFKIANFITCINILILCIMIFFFNKKDDKLQFDEPIKIEVVD